MNFCQLEESINKWTLELEEQEKAFVNQATQVNAWDKLLIANGEKITLLNQEVERVKLEQQQLEQELDYVVKYFYTIFIIIVCQWKSPRNDKISFEIVLPLILTFLLLFTRQTNLFRLDNKKNYKIVSLLWRKNWRRSRSPIPSATTRIVWPRIWTNS